MVPVIMAHMSERCQSNCCWRCVSGNHWIRSLVFGLSQMVASLPGKFDAKSVVAMDELSWTTKRFRTECTWWSKEVRPEIINK